MKKNLIFIVAIVILTLGLVGFAFERLAPASPASAASETLQVSNSAIPAEIASAPVEPLAQPVICVVTGIVGVLFGILAVAPLILNDPNL